MEKINLICGRTIYEGAKQAIKSIGDNAFDFSCQNLIVVPDRFSLIAEKLVFEQLNISSTINISVVGINKLAKTFIDESGLDCILCDTKQSVLLIRRAMQKLSKQFRCFGPNVSYSMCEEIQKNIAQIQSSGITASKLLAVNTIDDNLQNKIHDLAIIMQEYETLLNGRMDAGTLLTTFTNLLSTSNSYNNTNFYFVGFDSFTVQGYKIIENIIDACKSLTIATLLPQNQNNKNLYDYEMYENIINICEQKRKQINKVVCDELFDLEKTHVINNLFSYKPNAKENCESQMIIATSSKQDEIMFVAKEILNLVRTEGCKFSDFSICANETYNSQIEILFNQLGISTYIDKSIKLCNCNLSQFILTTFSLLENYFNSKDLIKFIYSDFVELSDDIKNNIHNYIIENGINGSLIKNISENFDCNIFNDLFEIRKTLMNENSCKVYIEFVRKILKDFNTSSKLDLICKNFANNNEIELEKTYSQIYDKFENLLNKIEQLMGDEQLSISDFSDILTCAIKQEEINSVPASCDCVLVGDCSKCFFEPSKFMFILGTNEGVLPIVASDTGIISDAEISKLDNCLISPTIRLINKRNKFKLFEILVCATQKTYICYNKINIEGKQVNPSSVVVSLKQCFKNIEEKDTIFDDFYLDINDQENFNKLQKNCVNTYFAQLNILKNNKYSPLIKNALKLKNISINNEKTQKNSIKNAKNLFFNNNLTKVSQLEKYFSCPFAHYLTYGLKLKEQKDSSMQANDFGNVLHRVSEIFVRNNCEMLSTLTSEQVEKKVLEIFNYLINNEFKNLNNKENKFAKQLLIDEAIRFCSFVCEEQSHSKFKPTKETLEMKFGFGNNNNKPLELMVNDEKFFVIGAIDRVDVCGNDFRIIDYKTGSMGADSAKYQALKYGNKIQIFVYMNSAEQNLNKKAFGVFYLPITNSFKKPNEDKYKLKGFLINDFNKVFACDDTLSYDNPKSKYIEAELSVSKANVSANKYVVQGLKVVNQEVFENMSKYSIEISKQAICEILGGNIMASPFKGSCLFCPYSSICGFSESLNIERCSDKKITAKDFEGEI